MNQKVLKTLEYYKIIDRLTDCAASEPGKKMCRELTPSSNFNEIVQTQTETADAVTRVRQKGSLSLAGVRDVRDSLKRLEIGSSLSIMELLSVSGLLTCAARAKNYGRHPENMECGTPRHSQNFTDRGNKMKSDSLKIGTQNAPHRALYHALGLTEEEIERPLVGIVSSYNEIVPGHMNIDKIVDAVKIGVAMAGGTPIVFPAIAVCDGIAMGHTGMKYSLVTRDLIADSTEAMALAHGFDALVMVPNCDKNVPGLLMAAARLNVPTVFVSGGPMLAGHVDGAKTSFSSISEAVGEFNAGKITEEKLREYECKTCPTCGSCSGMYTANSMNCLTEALGMGLRGNGTIPAVYSARIELAKHAGMAVMDMLRKNIRPRDIMTKDAIMNALTVDMALGCSTNSMLHLPAIAHECGIEINLDIANRISEKTPNLCHLAPAGRTYIEELDEAGGVYAVMNELSKKGLLHTDCITVTGKTVGENIKNCVNLNHDVIRPIENPYSQTGGIAVLRGNLAPEGSVVKRSAVLPEMLVHEGPARVFESEEDAQAAINAGKIVPGDVVVIRYEGPKGGPDVLRRSG